MQDQRKILVPSALWGNLGHSLLCWIIDHSLLTGNNLSGVTQLEVEEGIPGDSFVQKYAAIQAPNK